MNFNELYKKISDLDKPIQECGEMPSPSMSSSEPKPSMSVNLNAQGMDNIESLLKLMTKVNPETGPAVDKLLPTLSSPDMKPALPEPVDMDGDEDGELDHDDDEGMIGKGVGGIAGGALGGAAGAALGTAVGGPVGGVVGDVAGSIAGSAAGSALGDKVGNTVAGDDQEEESADGGFGSASTSPDVKQKDISASIPSGDDMHKVKKGYARSQPGDNPRAVEESDLSTKIKNDLFAQYESFKHR